MVNHFWKSILQILEAANKFLLFSIHTSAYINVGYKLKKKITGKEIQSLAVWEQTLDIQCFRKRHS